MGRVKTGISWAGSTGPLYSLKSNSVLSCPILTRPVTPSFMAVVVKKVGHLKGYGEILSIAHYGEQNGDLMADPELTFTIVNGEYFPISFKNDDVGLYQEVFDYNEDGSPIAIDIKLQSDLTTFANQWMRSIQEQQRL